MEHGLPGSQGSEQWGQHRKAYLPGSQVSSGNLWEWNNGGQPKEADSALETGMGIGGGGELIPLVWTALVLVGTSWRKAAHAPVLFCHASRRQQAAPHLQWFQTQKVQRSFLWTYSPCTRLLRPHFFFPAFHHFSSTSHFSSVKPPLAVRQSLEGGQAWRHSSLRQHRNVKQSPPPRVQEMQVTGRAVKQPAHR